MQPDHSERPPATPWQASGWLLLDHSDATRSRPTTAWWAQGLTRPELQPPPEACAAERALMDRLRGNPLRAVPGVELNALADADARENWQHWLRFRDSVQTADSLEAWYLMLMRSGRIETPPSLIDSVVQCIVRSLLEGVDDAIEWRAAELLFRPQRITVQDGVPLAGDRETLDFTQATGGYGELGWLLAQAKASMRRAEVRVLTAEDGAEYWRSAAHYPEHQPWLLDLRHHQTQDLGHGVKFEMARAHSALAALSRILERWVLRMMGVRVRIQPERRIQDERWRWHIGLDANATSILNDLYEGRAVSAERQQRLLSLFTLRFENPKEQRADLRQGNAQGTPVYLGMAMSEDGTLRLKPQNLLLNLPISPAA